MQTTLRRATQALRATNVVRRGALEPTWDPEVGEADVPSKTKVRIMGSWAAAQLHNKESPRNLLIDVPSTVTPHDVLHALREVGAVDLDYPLSFITPTPIGALRRPTLGTTYHLHAKSGFAAKEMHRVLTERPMFAASSSRAQLGWAPGRPSLGTGGLGIREGALVVFTYVGKDDWVNALLKAGRDGGDSWSRIAGDEIDAQYALKPGMSGRRVLVRGLPGHAKAEDVVGLAMQRGVQVEQGPDGCRRLPNTQWSVTSAWSLSTGSVTEAYRLARGINMNYYNNHVEGYSHRFLMRANVVW